MPTFRYAKLVRDNIPEFHKSSGHIVNGRRLAGAVLRSALTSKLHEEADEVATASTKKELIEEIADVQQIIDDLCAHEKITKSEIAEVQKSKAERKGGFANGEYIETVTIADENDKWAQYCRESPEKYPEVNQSGHVNPELPALEKGIYRHAKSGKLYELTHVSFHTETNEPLVLYRPLYESKYEIFVRPYNMFVASVELDGKMMPRFEKVDE